VNNQNVLHRTRVVPRYRILSQPSLRGVRGVRASELKETALGKQVDNAIPRNLSGDELRARDWNTGCRSNARSPMPLQTVYSLEVPCV
jgi:hypothetical protein